MARITNPIANRRTKDVLLLMLLLLLTVIVGKSIGSSRSLSIYIYMYRDGINTYICQRLIIHPKYQLYIEKNTHTHIYILSLINNAQIVKNLSVCEI